MTVRQDSDCKIEGDLLESSKNDINFPKSATFYSLVLAFGKRGVGEGGGRSFARPPSGGLLGFPGFLGARVGQKGGGGEGGG